MRMDASTLLVAMASTSSCLRSASVVRAFSSSSGALRSASSRGTTAAAFSAARIRRRPGEGLSSVAAGRLAFPALTSTSTSTSTSRSLSSERKGGLFSSSDDDATTGVEPSSTYDFDEDESSEQLLADRPLTALAMEDPPLNGDADTAVAVNGDATATTVNGDAAAETRPAGGRFDDLLSSVGLTGKLSTLADLPSKRPVSSDDVFCNRELKLSGIKAIGFDMDYTLAQYHQPQFDKLAFDGAKQKLVDALGYPEEVLNFEYDHTFWVRGLIIDTQRGNFLKIDRHKYVRLAYHGFEPISSVTRKHLYNRMFNKVPSFTEKHFVNMDTLFQLVDAHLFASLIEMKDKGEYEFLDEKTYGEIYRQVRECVDLCHRDGVIKDEVARNPEKYIVPDPNLIPMLQSYRESGVKVFLLTNSYWEYTSVAMNFLYHQRKESPEVMVQNEWMDLFNIVIVGSCKPAYLTDSHLNLFRVRPEDGSLLNTDGLFEIEALGKDGAAKFLAQGKTFQGGNWQHLTAMLDVEAGEEIMYVGDHLYADVLRSKRTLGWRSCFIVPELAEEMRVFREQLPLRRKITELRKLRDELSLHGDAVYRNAQDPDSPEVEAQLFLVERDDAAVKDALTDLTERYHAAFHPVWGQMFHAGYQDSRFAYFVQNYACVYTSKATNLGLATTSRSYRTSGELLPHDNLLADDGHTDFGPGGQLMS